MKLNRAILILTLYACTGGGFAVCLLAGEPSNSPDAPPATNAAPAFRTLGEPEVLQLVTGALQDGFVRGQAALDLRFNRPWTACRIPDEPLTVKILEMPNTGISSCFIIRFELFAGDRSLGSWQTPVTAHLWREVWVARTATKQGSPVSNADIARERRDLLALHSPLAEFSQDDSSLEFSEQVPAGFPILARDVKARPVIRRGQLTNALVSEGLLSVTMKVEALEDGTPGQIIHARNPLSSRELSGKVLDEQTILISL